MKIHASLALCLAALSLVSGAPTKHSLSFAAVVTTQARNIISGTVFGESHQPVSDVYVELFDDFHSNLKRAKTDGSGRFMFNGLVDGRYRVKVLPYGTDYQEQTTEVILTSVSSAAGSGSDRQNIDIYLRVNPRAVSSPFSGGTGVVFAQAVPDEAKKHYEEGLRYLREKKEKDAFLSLRRSLEIFPEYYVALDRLGAEYAMRGLYDSSFLEAAFLLLTKAVEVNPRGFSSLYGLGWTQYQMGMLEPAIENLKKATTVYGKSADAYLWLGRALKKKAVLDQSEIALKRANELANGKAARVHWQLAELYRDQKRYREAADELELFLKLEPKAEDAEKIKILINQLRQKATAASAPAPGN